MLNLLLYFRILILIVAAVPAIASPSEIKDCQNQRQFTFSWPFSEKCDLLPRGGTSDGATVKLASHPHPGWLSLQEPGITKFEKDRRAILAMAGAYRASFDFLETVGFTLEFSPDRPYQSWGTEYVYVVEATEKFISLQHIMVMFFNQKNGSVSAPMVMKHWRQDWQFQKREILEYAGRNEWARRQYHRKEVAGTWSQSVFQVDDSPRYEAIGKWQHYPNFSTWLSSETWRPLPRRESSVRDDYHVLIGTNRHTILPSGWVQEEENLKAVLDDRGELISEGTYLSKELGVNRYHLLEGFDHQAGDLYWEKTGPYWGTIRQVWREVIGNGNKLRMQTPKGKPPLFVPLFEYAEKVSNSGEYDEQAALAFAREVINSYVTID